MPALKSKKPWILAIDAMDIPLEKKQSLKRTGRKREQRERKAERDGVKLATIKEQLQAGQPEHSQSPSSS